MFFSLLMLFSEIFLSNSKWYFILSWAKSASLLVSTFNRLTRIQEYTSVFYLIPFPLNHPTPKASLHWPMKICYRWHICLDICILGIISILIYLCLSNKQTDKKCPSFADEDLLQVAQVSDLPRLRFADWHAGTSRTCFVLHSDANKLKILTQIFAQIFTQICKYRNLDENIDVSSSTILQAAVACLSLRALALLRKSWCLEPSPSRIFGPT